MDDAIAQPVLPKPKRSDAIIAAEKQQEALKMVEGIEQAKGGFLERTNQVVEMMDRLMDFGWPVDINLRKRAVAKIKQIVNYKVPATADEHERVRANLATIKAIEVLVRMTEHNQRDRHLMEKYIRVDEGKATGRVAIEPIIAERPVHVIESKVISAEEGTCP